MQRPQVERSAYSQLASMNPSRQIPSQPQEPSMPAGALSNEMPLPVTADGWPVRKRAMCIDLMGMFTCRIGEPLNPQPTESTNTAGDEPGRCLASTQPGPGGNDGPTRGQPPSQHNRCLPRTDPEVAPSHASDLERNSSHLSERKRDNPRRQSMHRLRPTSWRLQGDGCDGG